MKAVVYDKSARERLVFTEVEKPVPADDEVLVKIHAVSVNAYDHRTMKMGIIPKSRIFGEDIAGRVEAIGKGVKNLHVGDEVVANLGPFGSGGFAEYVAVPERALSLKPACLSFDEAAAIPMAAVTALQALRDKGGIQSGHRVLICGAGGGVGTFAVQLAKYFGATVTAVCGEKNVPVMRSLGADYVIDYRKQDFAQTGGHYDLVLATNGNRSLLAYRRVLAPEGTCVMVGGALTQIVSCLLFGKLLSAGGKKLLSFTAKASKPDLESIIRIAEDGKVRPVLDRRYPLSEAAQAVRYISEGHAKGKVIVGVCSEA